MPLPVASGLENLTSFNPIPRNVGKVAVENGRDKRVTEKPKIAILRKRGLGPKSDDNRSTQLLFDQLELGTINCISANARSHAHR